MSMDRAKLIGKYSSNKISQLRLTYLKDRVELGVTALLMLEIMFRFLSDWRGFRKSKQNWTDLSLALVTCIIQLPPIHNSGRVYEWLTLFQILRVYRVVWAIPITRDLLVS